MADFIVRCGDTARTLNYNLTVGASVVDLTYATCSLSLYDGARKLKYDYTPTIVTAASGSVSWDVEATATNKSGLKYMEFKVVYNDGTVLKLPTSGFITMDVRDTITDTSTPSGPPPF